MGGKFELCRIAGLPVVIDVSFIFLILLWGQHYFINANTQRMSMGVVIIIGLAASILVHEFAHAVVGSYFGVRPSHVELNGLGGLCYWASPMRQQAWPRIAISLAGPASNLLLYFLFEGLAETSLASENPQFWNVVNTLSTVNRFMCLFNLLPAFPLDGSKALEAFLGLFLNGLNSTRVVACLGLVLSAFVAFAATRYGIFFLLVAFMLAQTNWQVLQSARMPWQRWD